MEKHFDVKLARQVLSEDLLPNLERYHFPSSKPKFTLENAQRQVERIRKALQDYETAADVGVADEAMLEVMRAAGTRSSSGSLYGGPGGVEDSTNPHNPVGQRISKAANRIWMMARREHDRLKDLK